MASLYNIFSQNDVEVILDALEKRRNFYKTQASNPVRGYGKASEILKKQQWADKAQDVQRVINLFVENLD